jgi:spermidine synthase
VMALGALLVLAIPVVDEPVLERVVSWNPGPRANPLVAAIVLFGLPSIVFAGVTPIAIRLLARSVSNVGRVAGRLFALSTAGSIAGTFATAFFLIPEFGTDQLLALSAATLFAGVALVALVERMPVAIALGIVAAAGAAYVSTEVSPERGARLEGAAAKNWSPVYYRDEGPGGGVQDTTGFEVVFQKDTQYHRLAVTDQGDSRFLRFDNSFQSGMYKERPFATRFAYSDYFQLALAYNPDAERMLLIGLGGASAPKRMWRDFPDLRIHTVEIDPVVRDVAYEYFEMPRSPRLTVDVADGRQWLARNDEKWDVIAIDAYFSDAIPFHLTTAEFMELVSSRLAPGGVVISNVIGSVAGSGSQLFRAFYKTYRQTFPTVLVHPVVERGEDPAADLLRNIIVVAGDFPSPTREFLRERWDESRREHPSSPFLGNAIRHRYDRQIPTRDVPTLTDDYAPLDALLPIQ